MHAKNKDEYLYLQNDINMVWQNVFNDQGELMLAINLEFSSIPFILSI